MSGITPNTNSLEKSKSAFGPLKQTLKHCFGLNCSDLLTLLNSYILSDLNALELDAGVSPLIPTLYMVTTLFIVWGSIIELTISQFFGNDSPPCDQH